MATVNFTGAVDRDLLKRAKIIAAKSDTSINALFNGELRYLVETCCASRVGRCVWSTRCCTNSPAAARRPAQ